MAWHGGGVRDGGRSGGEKDRERETGRETGTDRQTGRGEEGEEITLRVVKRWIVSLFGWFLNVLVSN